MVHITRGSTPGLRFVPPALSVADEDDQLLRGKILSASPVPGEVQRLEFDQRSNKNHVLIHEMKKCSLFVKHHPFLFGSELRVCFILDFEALIGYSRLVV